MRATAFPFAWMNAGEGGTAYLSGEGEKAQTIRNSQSVYNSRERGRGKGGVVMVCMYINGHASSANRLVAMVLTKADKEEALGVRMHQRNWAASPTGSWQG